MNVSLDLEAVIPQHHIPSNMFIKILKHSLGEKDYSVNTGNIIVKNDASVHGSLRGYEATVADIKEQNLEIIKGIAYTSDTQRQIISLKKFPFIHTINVPKYSIKLLLDTADKNDYTFISLEKTRGQFHGIYKGTLGTIKKSVAEIIYEETPDENSWFFLFEVEKIHNTTHKINYFNILENKTYYQVSQSYDDNDDRNDDDDDGNIPDLPPPRKLEDLIT